MHINLENLFLEAGNVPHKARSVVHLQIKFRKSCYGTCSAVLSVSTFIVYRITALTLRYITEHGMYSKEAERIFIPGVSRYISRKCEESFVECM